MNKRFAQLIVIMALSSTFAIGGHEVFAQGAYNDVCSESKQEAKRIKAIQRNDRWAARQEAKMVKQLVSERKFDTPATARGSEAGFYHNGEYISLGYFDKTNSFRSYTRKVEPRIKLRDPNFDPSVVGLWEKAEARSACDNILTSLTRD
jgi:hypothetical protein